MKPGRYLTTTCERCGRQHESVTCPLPMPPKRTKGKNQPFCVEDGEGEQPNENHIVDLLNPLYQQIADMAYNSTDKQARKYWTLVLIRMQQVNAGDTLSQQDEEVYFSSLPDGTPFCLQPVGLGEYNVVFQLMPLQSFDYERLVRFLSQLKEYNDPIIPPKFHNLVEQLGLARRDPVDSTDKCWLKTVTNEQLTQYIRRLRSACENLKG